VLLWLALLWLALLWRRPGAAARPAIATEGLAAVAASLWDVPLPGWLLHAATRNPGTVITSAAASSRGDRQSRPC
jgi:hypothetical protein